VVSDAKLTEKNIREQIVWIENLLRKPGWGYHQELRYRLQFGLFITSAAQSIAQLASPRFSFQSRSHSA